LVARITNKRVICQVIYATIQGDRVLTSCDSNELGRYGCPVGLTNYAACYATGLLIARRTLDKVGMADAIAGVEEANAEEFHVEDEDNERKPFKVIFDVGLQRTITGCRLFAILKGAVDGGLHIPHSISKFPGYTEPEEKGMDYEYDASANLERILGNHVQEFMDMLKEEDPERYKVAFSKFIEEDKEEDLEDMYKETHAAIRENPKPEPKEKKNITHKRMGNKIVSSDGTEHVRMVKKSHKERKARVAQKLQAAATKLLAEAGEEEEEE
jgi:large subunit ribosomal protein L5e